MICQKAYSVNISDVDFTKSLKLSALFNYFQDIACVGAESLGIGIDTLIEKYNVTWVITRFRINIFRNPVLNEKITIETWHHGHKRLEFERDFRVLDSDGNVIASAASAWIILDIKTREIRRPELITYDPSTIRDERAIDGKFGRLRAVGELEAVYKKRIGYSDIDLNGHINNSKYVDYAMDCFCTDRFSEHSVKSFAIDYISEALPEDMLVLYKDISSNTSLSYIEGINEKSGKVVFRSQIEFETKS
ncbi:MAG TPA: thioesterase [Pseudobacteroides sp.]|nr:thioesterase [Pseudobacteroides sp.]